MTQLAPSDTPKPNQDSQPARKPGLQPPDLANEAPPRVPPLNAEALRAAVGKIPETVAAVRWHPPEGASEAERNNPPRVLIHVSQMHTPPAEIDPATLPAGLKKQLAAFLPKAQEQLTSVLNTITQNGGPKGVLLEGMDPETAANYRSQIAQLKEHQQTAATLEQAFKTETSAATAAIHKKLTQNFGPNPDAQQQKLLNAVTFLHSYQSMRENFARDPVLSLAQQGRVQLVGPEDRKLLDENVALARKNPNMTIDDPAVAAVMDKRDAHIVAEFGRSKATASTAVLGGGHDLKREVAQWNKANPTNKITLVEVVPNAVQAYLDGKEKP